MRHSQVYFRFFGQGPLLINLELISWINIYGEVGQFDIMSWGALKICTRRKMHQQLAYIVRGFYLLILVFGVYGENGPSGFRGLVGMGAFGSFC